jgi:hypothetical protein
VTSRSGVASWRIQPTPPKVRHGDPCADRDDILDGHVGLDLECFDQIYLNGWVPNLQVSGQVVDFLTHHLGFPIPSPAILEKIGLRFRRAVTEYAGQRHRGGPLRQGRAEAGRDAPHLDRLARQGRVGWAAIGVAQEFQRVCSPTPPTTPTPTVVGPAVRL